MNFTGIPTTGKRPPNSDPIMSEAIDCVVIGAGVVGLATARRLALAGREVIVLERASMIGTETSSRNSEVIHAGIYYPKESVKALTCVAGRKRLYRYCADHGVAHRRVGKLIVATTESQAETLSAIKRRAEANGVDDMEALDGEAAMAMEPAVACTAALHSPSTGIIDSHALMLAFQGEAEDRGAMIAFGSEVVGGRVHEGGDGGVSVDVRDRSGTELTLNATLLVNSAGLHAQAVARKIAGLPDRSIPPIHYARGCYFTMNGGARFKRLIYPVPEPGGLGVHVTIDMGGQVRFGPDVEWIDEIAYDVDPARARQFYPAIRSYYPDLPEGSLHADYAGIRPKLVAEGEPAGDFVVQGPDHHGVAGLVNFYGIESPGLTASMPLADMAAEALGVAPPDSNA